MRAADRLEAELAPELTLSAGGEFAAALPRDPGGNLVLRAARALRERHRVAAGARLRLEKRLPVAAGIGGGSSDAAAALRLLRHLWRLPDDDAALMRLGGRLGSDVPACVAGGPALVSGAGEAVEAQPALPGFGLVLANPGTPVSTAAVFAARAGAWSEPVAWSAPGTLAQLVSRLEGAGNDLTAAAAAAAPGVAAALGALEGLAGCLLARMSGSGATCFGVFPTAAAASAAAAALAAAHPGWWVAATEPRGGRPEVVPG